MLISRFVYRSLSEPLEAVSPWGEVWLISHLFFCFIGHYQSHWRLYHHGERFGHRVWCSIVVDPKELLEPKETDPLVNKLEVTPQVGNRIVSNIMSFENLKWAK